MFKGFAVVVVALISTAQVDQYRAGSANLDRSISGVSA